MTDGRVATLTITEAQVYAALSHAARMGQPCPSNVALGKIIGASGPAAADTIGRIAAKGYIEVRAIGRNRRIVHVVALDCSTVTADRVPVAQAAYLAKVAERRADRERKVADMAAKPPVKRVREKPSAQAAAKRPAPTASTLEHAGNLERQGIARGTDALAAACRRYFARYAGPGEDWADVAARFSVGLPSHAATALPEHRP